MNMFLEKKIDVIFEKRRRGPKTVTMYVQNKMNK
jgi:hypothetical protein